MVRVPLASGRARWILTVAILGSGMAFLDGTVVNVALPAIAEDLGGGITTQQWVLDGYLLTLSGLLLPAGVAGDRFGRRRVFLLGLLAFTAASIACGFAPTATVLIGARVVQGVGAAILVPGSLALINENINLSDRGKAVGLWAGMSGVTTAVGPFLGGWLVDAVSWQWVFWMNVPLAAGAVAITLVHLSADPARVEGRIGFDIPGTITVTIGLAGVVFALIERSWPAGIVGVIALAAFVLIQVRSRDPLIAAGLFAARQFTGVNLTTLMVYGALGVGMFLLTLQLQQSLGYSALAAGAATVPMTVILLLGSPVMGGLTDRIGARVPMTVGSLVAGVGFVLLARVVPGATFIGAVLPGIVVFGTGMALLVAPLTTAALASVPEAHVGAASGINNAVSRVAGLLTVAVVPGVAGITAGAGEPLGHGFGVAMWVCAGLCVRGTVIAWLTVAGHDPSTGLRTP